MWREDVLRLICFSLCGGIVQGVVGDIFYLASYIFSQIFSSKGKILKGVLSALRDIAFGVSAGCVLLVVLYYGNNGRFRASSLFFSVLSFVAYSLSVGRLLRFVIKTCFDLLFRFTESVLNRFFNIVKKVWSFLSGNIRKNLETYKNKRRLKIEKRKDNKLRRDKKRGKRAFRRGKPCVAKECEDGA